jgi:hypothetical protein
MGIEQFIPKERMLLKQYYAYPDVRQSFASSRSEAPAVQLPA